MEEGEERRETREEREEERVKVVGEGRERGVRKPEIRIEKEVRRVINA